VNIRFYYVFLFLVLLNLFLLVVSTSNDRLLLHVVFGQLSYKSVFDESSHGVHVVFDNFRVGDLEVRLALHHEPVPLVLLSHLHVDLLHLLEHL